VAFAQGGKKNTSATSAKTIADRSAAQTIVIAELPERKPLSYYTSGVRDNLFDAPLAPAPPPKITVTKAPTTKVTVPSGPPAIVDPFADYTYTGTMQVGGQLVALVENNKTKEGLFLKPGDSLVGGKVTAINDRMVTLDVMGTPKMLAKTDDFKLTPLDKSAAFMTQKAEAQVAGQPGMTMTLDAKGAAPAGMPGMENLPDNIRQRIEQRMQSMTPDQRASFQNRMMNRSFERGTTGGSGGGRGGRNRGGFGGGGFGGGGYGGGGFGGG